METPRNRSRPCTYPIRTRFPICSTGGFRSNSRICASALSKSRKPCWVLRMACTRTLPAGPVITVIPPESVTTSRSTGPLTVKVLSNDPCSSAETTPAAKIAAARARAGYLIGLLLRSSLCNYGGAHANVPLLFGGNLLIVLLKRRIPRVLRCSQWRFATCAFRRRSKTPCPGRRRPNASASRNILGQAETEISEKFSQAASTYQNNPVALHLRYEHALRGNQ